MREPPETTPDQSAHCLCCTLGGARGGGGGGGWGGGCSAYQAFQDCRTIDTTGTVRRLRTRAGPHLLVRLLLGDGGGAKHGLLIALVRLCLRCHAAGVHPVDPVSRPAGDSCKPRHIRGTLCVPAGRADAGQGRADRQCNTGRARANAVRDAAAHSDQLYLLLGGQSCHLEALQRSCI